MIVEDYAEYYVLPDRSHGYQQLIAYSPAHQAASTVPICTKCKNYINNKNIALKCKN